jgi:signal transduction histidine kinase
MSLPPDDSTDIRERLDELEEQVRDLDAQNLELEQEVVKRGVKLSCANVALARAKIAFDEISRSREEAVQDIAHDLRTPLTSIRGAAQNVLDGIAGPINDDVREYVEIMRDQSDRLVDVVNWLVEAVRISNEARTLEPDRVDVGALVRDTVASLSPIARERGIALEADAPSVHAEVDAPKLRQVVENLVGNALKFTREGKVEVSVAEAGQDVTLTVADTGIGMNDEQRKNLFRRYYRGTSAEGSGLGLLIVKELVFLHRGEIDVQSTLGEGTTFTIRLPNCHD